jgi:hypothetical protein
MCGGSWDGPGRGGDCVVISERWGMVLTREGWDGPGGRATKRAYYRYLLIYPWLAVLALRPYKC